MPVSTAKDIHLAVELQACKGWQGREDFWNAVRIAIDDSGLIPLENRLIEVAGGRRARPVAANPAEWFDGIHETRDEWDGRDFHRLKPQERFAAFLRAPLGEGWDTSDAVYGLPELMLFANRYGDLYNVVELGCTLLKPSQNVSVQAAMERVEDVSRLLAGLCRKWAEGMRAEYAIVTNRDSLEIYGREVLNRVLKRVHWCNFYGPAYIERYGSETFMGAPGWRAEALGDGIWYQVREHFADPEPKGLKERIKAHFAAAGFRVAA